MNHPENTKIKYSKYLYPGPIYKRYGSKRSLPSIMQNVFSPRERKTLIWLIIACILTYLLGWQIPLMEIDAAQYANLSREMILHKSFLRVYDQGLDYLDKPPMLLWLGAISMKIFGIHDWAYRLPSFLFSILSVYSTYRFSKIYYQERVALLCALVLAGCQAMFLINHDVRTDTMLMGWIMFSIWQLAVWIEKKNWVTLILASFAIAGGMMTKGPIALIVPVFAFSAHFMLRRSWAMFFRWEYLVMVAIIGILLIPMSIGLYQQFDLHPEKVMYGQNGISGLRFYYWTQSFGRFTGESTWKEKVSFFFYFENLLWGFLPWTLFFILGLIMGLWEWVRKRFYILAGEEGISLGGFLITYCALARSQSQLPHYIYVVLPLASVVTGKMLHRLIWDGMYERWIKPLSILHYVIFSILVVVLFVLLVLPFPPVQILLIFSALASTILLIVSLVRHWLPISALLTSCVFTIVLINVWLDSGFYPKLLQYQMSIPVTRFIRENNLDKNRIVLYHMEMCRSLDFYNQHAFYVTKQPDSLKTNDYLLTNKAGMDMINKELFTTIDTGVAFHVTTLSISVLNPKTRPGDSDAYYLLKRN